jgi:hypothetical protein
MIVTDSQPDHRKGTWPCPRCHSTRSDAEAVCSNCEWDPNAVATDAAPVGPPPLPQPAVVLRWALVLLVVIAVALNFFPRTLPARFVIGAPGFADPNWVRSHKALGFPATWLSLTHNSNRALQVTKSGWMIHPAGLAMDAMLMLLLVIGCLLVGPIARTRRPQAK